MIIKYPTGLYESVLPVNPDDGGNVTFVISNAPPPRSNAVFPKIPDGFKNRKRTGLSGTPSSRRSTLGKLIFTDAGTGRSGTGSGTKQYEVGQTLDFTDDPEIELTASFVTGQTAARHDSNLLDLAAAGVSPDVISALDVDVVAIHKRLQDEANALRAVVATNEVTINESQKSLNEANKALKSLQILSSYVATDAYEAAILSVQSKLTEMKATQDAAVAAREAGVLALNAKLDEVRRVAEVMR